MQPKFVAFLLAATAATTFTTGALAADPATPAGTNTPRVDARQERQADRIEQGTQSGALTAREQRRLNREQKVVAHAEAHAKADGTVTHAERRKLNHLQNHTSRDIHRQKHDAQTAVTPAAKP